MTTPPGAQERAMDDAPRRAAVALTKARLSAKENAGWLTALLRDYAADAIAQAVQGAYEDAAKIAETLGPDWTYSASYCDGMVQHHTDRIVAALRARPMEPR